MSHKTAALFGNCRRLLVSEARDIHTAVPQYVHLNDARGRPLGAAEAVKEEVNAAGKGMTGKLKAVYDRVANIGSKETETLFGDYPDGNVGRPKSQPYDSTEFARKGRGRGAVDELGDAECGGTGSRHMKDSSDYKE
ncbi:unnamed protein product [Strongylus vulgaris]|uniref:Uncharacterized protein n=1 Tax=Strongylus vulgaris TaxID=40348 RepID=A0A3P7LJ80_STRVU|nr:unnamed protein product [Strongylus vulgaris]